MSNTLVTSPKLSDPDVFALRKEETALEIDWLNEMQQAAWSRYLELPSPVRTNEKWRFASLKRIREIGDFTSPDGQPSGNEDLLDRSHRLQSVAGRLIMVDEVLAQEPLLDPELAAKGVIFTTLQDAMVQHPELVKAYFLKESPELGSEKYEALHVALMRNGAFLYIPDNVEVKVPFVVYHWARQDGAALFPHTIFVTGKHAKANLIEFQECAAEETHHLVIANAHLHADDGAQPEHTIVQNWNLNTLSFQLNTSNAQRDTQPRSTIINTGSAQARQEVHGKIYGSGSNVELYALNVPKASQEFDQRTLQTHIAPHSRSDLLFKNALMEDARTIFSGLIIVEDEAQQTDAYQTNNNLMLSDHAEANSLPGLEIKANDVKCSHGATTGKIDDSELFYFLARGIPRRKAQELMVYGYFEEILSKLGNEELAAIVRDLVQLKFSD